jgi:hypothetical protein
MSDDELTEGYFQQDNAAAHSARQTIAYLKEFFDTRAVEFPARSPDHAIMLPSNVTTVLSLKITCCQLHSKITAYSPNLFEGTV